MAHYALLDENNIVINVITGVDENVVQYDNGKEVGGSQEAWELFYATRPWLNSASCKQTSYNTLGGTHKLGGVPMRKNFAGVGFVYDELRDAFIPPQPFESWTLNEETCLWEPPIPRPEDATKIYKWNEETRTWDSLSA